ncbi:hypothetical protein OsJ_32121 [Oryza sativa Japonica Group]|uniref:Uncharacterized protein n=1 Tax=Oryza sativa subsp. japonica TaxID=39947 RepID=B9G6K6_ORYSJ|nr:hypothetical protein OsJ_32121 [Oryza sativa Japonica Group]
MSSSGTSHVNSVARDGIQLPLGDGSSSAPAHPSSASFGLVNGCQEAGATASRLRRPHLDVADAGAGAAAVLRPPRSSPSASVGASWPEGITWSSASAAVTPAGIIRTPTAAPVATATAASAASIPDQPGCAAAATTAATVLVVAVVAGYANCKELTGRVSFMCALESQDKQIQVNHRKFQYKFSLSSAAAVRLQSQTVLGYDEAVRAHRRSCHPGCSVHHHLKRAIAGRRGGGEGGEGAAVAEAGAAHKAALPGATTTSGEVSSTNVFVSAATTSGEVRTSYEFAASRRRSRFNQRLRATMNP